MENYKKLSNKIYEDLQNNKIYIHDYIRIKRKEEYDKDILKKFGVLILTIESYKYDHEIIKISEKNKYELMKVEEIINEIDRTISFFENYS